MCISLLAIIFRESECMYLFVAFFASAPTFPTHICVTNVPMMEQVNLPSIQLIPRNNSNSQTTYDESGSQVLKSVLLPPSQPSYALASLPPCLQQPPLLRGKSHHAHVPPLAYYAITRHVKNLETLQRSAFLKHIGSTTPLPYPQDTNKNDLLQLLIPHMHHQTRSVRLQLVDPRLWITIIRSYWPETLPSSLLTYPMPLADGYLPYLQYIDPTPHFTLFVVLELKGVNELNDETIVRLKVLHHLAVLDASQTGVGSVGVRKLTDSLNVGEEGGVDDDGGRPRGPWKLRALSLRGCKGVDDKVVLSLRNFPLLSVVDLRQTKCQARPTIHGWSDIIPDAHFHTDLYYPAPASEWIPSLTELAKQRQHNNEGGPLFESKQPAFSIYVHRLYHPKPPVKRLEYGRQSKEARTHLQENGWYALAPDGRLGSGSMDVLERRERARDANFDMRESTATGERRAGNPNLGGMGDPTIARKRMGNPNLNPRHEKGVAGRAQGLDTFGAQTPEATISMAGRSEMGPSHPAGRPNPPPQAGTPYSTTATAGLNADDEDSIFWASLEARERSLDELRIRAYNEQQAAIRIRESERAKRRERQVIEQSRDPSAISDLDLLNRQLIVIRIPPPYSSLKEATDRWLATRRRLAMIKEAAAGKLNGKRGLTQAQAEDGLIVVDKKRRTEDRGLWGEMVAQSEPVDYVAVGSSHQQQAGVSGLQSAGARKSKNPWARTPLTDVKKIVRS
ncbi:hypothetical protein FRB95_014770 [Tulasnella sp. JGI-2019a]|nr:hypothetical protein FRB95_014770 [Tulasnella sp. JGI-2019a]